jgi:hypothetical protein
VDFIRDLLTIIEVIAVDETSRGSVDGFFHHLVEGFTSWEMLPTPATVLIVNYDTCNRKKVFIICFGYMPCGAAFLCLSDRNPSPFHHFFSF